MRWPRRLAGAIAFGLGVATAAPALAAVAEATVEGAARLVITDISGDISVTGLAPVVSESTRALPRNAAEARADAEGALGGPSPADVGSTLDVSTELFGWATGWRAVGSASGDVLSGGFLLDNQGTTDGAVAFSLDYLFEIFAREVDNPRGGAYAELFYDVSASNIGEVTSVGLVASTREAESVGDSAADTLSFFVPVAAGQTVTVGVDLRSFAIATVPLPAAAPLLAGGLSLFFALGRRRRRRAPCPAG